MPSVTSFVLLWQRGEIGNKGRDSSENNEFWFRFCPFFDNYVTLYKTLSTPPNIQRQFRRLDVICSVPEPMKTYWQLDFGNTHQWSSNQSLKLILSRQCTSKQLSSQWQPFCIGINVYKSNLIRLLKYVEKGCVTVWGFFIFDMIGWKRFVVWLWLKQFKNYNNARELQNLAQSCSCIYFTD